MNRRIRLGVLVPSSNTAVEPLTQAIISSINLPDATVSVHFSRFAVTEISQSDTALAQFDHVPILAAAELLAHAKVDVIGWSGTSAGWLGFDRDHRLCSAIRDSTGIPATSSTLALNKLLKCLPEPEIPVGLVTPYLSTMNDAIIRNYSSIGVRMSCEQHLDLTDNLAISDINDQQLNEMVDRMVQTGTKCITTFCTNFRAAQLVPKWETKYQGLVVLDTVSTVIWDMLNLASIETSSVKGWGKMFDLQV